jgi:hypothetical protein
MVKKENYEVLDLKGIVELKPNDHVMLKTSSGLKGVIVRANAGNWLTFEGMEDGSLDTMSYPEVSGNVLKTASNGYICFYGGKKVEVYADTTYHAQEQAYETFKKMFPRKNVKQYDIKVWLAEKDGQPVMHSTTELASVKTADEETDNLENGTKANVTFTVTTTKPMSAGLGGGISGNIGGMHGDLEDVEGEDIYSRAMQTEHVFTALFSSTARYTWTPDEIKSFVAEIVTENIQSRFSGLEFEIDDVEVTNIRQSSVKTAQGPEKPPRDEEVPGAGLGGGDMSAGGGAPTDIMTPPPDGSRPVPGKPMPAGPEAPPAIDLTRKMTPGDLAEYTNLMEQYRNAADSGDMNRMREAERKIEALVDKYSMELTKDPDLSPQAFVARLWQGHVALRRNMIPLLTAAYTPIPKTFHKFPVMVKGVSYSKCASNDYSPLPQDGAVEWVLHLRRMGSDIWTKTGSVRVNVSEGEAKMEPWIYDGFGRRYALDTDGIDEFFGMGIQKDMQKLEAQYLRDEKNLRRRNKGSEVVVMGREPRTPPSYGEGSGNTGGLN